MASTNSITQPRVMAVMFDYVGVIIRVWRNVEKAPISPGILQEFVAEWRTDNGGELWNLENMENGERGRLTDHLDNHLTDP